ncbi:hypothetical protein AB9P05_22200 [Roseivirga sp. BDSF3-8]|uniref:hypothetical protein n=1 Tax=Roseivirga sp. BDSF3-8 TaxID=3241598 RepID=UPI003531EC2B
MTKGFSQASADAAGIAGEAFQMANKRYKASANSADFLFMLTVADKKQHYLAIVSKDTGETLQTIDLGRDKKPSYEVDVVTNQGYWPIV